MKNNQKYVFISGIPASGKSYLAGKLAEQMNMLHVEIDELRDEMRKDPELEKWVDFYWDKDEKEYWETTSCEEQWENLKKQSEAFWPTILEKIKEIQKSNKSAIFEGVNILPHLVTKDLDFPGVILVGDSFEAIFERNKKDPRWGKTEELQRKEAEAFFYCEGPKYKKEAIKYGYPVFSNTKEAGKELLKMLE